MATEQGSKAVEEGVKLSEKSGSSIKTLAEILENTVDTFLQIANSNKEQLVGVEQVTQALEDIQQATSQNLESMRQMEEGAHNLKELGLKLTQLAEKYRI